MLFVAYYAGRFLVVLIIPDLLSTKRWSKSVLCCDWSELAMIDISLMPASVFGHASQFADGLWVSHEMTSHVPSFKRKAGQV